MTLADLFTSLSYGPLSNLAIGGEGSGAIPDQHKPRLTTLINQALTTICGRFPIFERELVLRVLDHMTTYPLKKIHANSDGTNVVKYIADSSYEPFLEDVLKIFRVYDENGWELPLNDAEEGLGLFTPLPDTLHVTQPVSGNAYFVQYQANHPKLKWDVPSQEILLPAALMQPLECQVAYLVLSPMNGQEHAVKAGEALQRYEMICQEIEGKDLASTSWISSTTKLNERGFV